MERCNGNGCKTTVIIALCEEGSHRIIDLLAKTGCRSQRKRLQSDDLLVIIVACPADPVIISFNTVPLRPSL